MKKQFLYKALITILILGISLLHYFSEPQDSAIHNFFKLLYFVPIIVASFNFGFRGGIVTSIVIGFIYSPYLLLTLEFGVQTINELLDIVLFFTMGIITGTLVEKKNITLLNLDNQLKKYILLERYTNGIIQSIKSGVIAINNDWLITNVNEGAKIILDVDNECIGQNLLEVFSCCETVKDKISQAMIENKIIENIEINMDHRNKETAIKVSLFPLTFENINKGLVIIVEDITEMKKIQHQLQRNDKLAALGQLSTGIAHEIRNPLAIIKVAAQSIKKELKNNESLVTELDIIDEEIDRANSVVKSLMEFGKPSKNEKVYTSIEDVIEDVLIIVNKYTTQHEVTIEFEKSENHYINLDKEQLKQAFINIIFNAIEAMPLGGKIKILTEIINHHFIKVSFEDNGTGIKETDLNKIYNPFFTTKDEGTGLGLSIVHRIIEEHDGMISVISKIGLGTRFDITFPIKEDK